MLGCSRRTLFGPLGPVLALAPDERLGDMTRTGLCHQNRRPSPPSTTSKHLLPRFERRSCRIQLQYDHFVLRGTTLSSLSLSLSLSTHTVLNSEKKLCMSTVVFTPFKIYPVRPLINTINTFDSSVCHDQPRGTSNQYPKRPNSSDCHRDRHLYAILPQCSTADSAYLDVLSSSHGNFKFELNYG
jgi:hypothetical protein